MEIEITPEPGPEEREALERALARLVEEDVKGGQRGAWWREGVGENVNPDAETA